MSAKPEATTASSANISAAVRPVRHGRHPADPDRFPWHPRRFVRMTGETILICRRVPAIIWLLARCLSRAGIKFTVRTGHLHAPRHPDVILLDVVMPGTDGFAVCGNQGRRRTRDSGPLRTRDDTESPLRDFAGRDHTQPFQADEVLVRVETRLKTARLTCELMERNASRAIGRPALKRRRPARQSGCHSPSATQR